MASIVVAGDTSGTVTLSAPAVSGTTTLTLPTANGTLVTTASGQTLTSPTIATPTITGQATIPTINLTGGQITFPATQNPSSDANTLDDYEEGTFTPTVSFQTGSATYTSSGTYTKVGRLVLCHVRITITSAGASGFVFFTVPFTNYSTSQFTNGCGSERAITGKQLQAWQDGSGGSSFGVMFYDYTTAATNSYQLNITVAYPAA
jgi:hypothetical protein